LYAAVTKRDESTDNPREPADPGRNSAIDLTKSN
jgi:hypothetical protein